MTIAPLPEPLTTVTVPDTFQPSSFARLEQCALSVLGVPPAGEPRSEALLTPHPLAYLGIILHHVRRELLDGRWGGESDGRAAARKAIEKAVQEVEQELRAQSRTAALVPLRAATGRRAWVKRVEKVEQWASALKVAVTADAPRPVHASTVAGSGAQPSPARLGAERPLEDLSLRLRGRPDWTELVDVKKIFVSDFKSGRTHDEEGRILDGHVVQVQLYALLIERAHPGFSVQPFIDGEARYAVPWDSAARGQILARLRRVDQTLPPGAVLHARELARPGPHCVRCGLRPICAAYLEEVPSWWPDGQRHPRPLPLDVWGRVGQVEEKDGEFSVWVVDAAARHVLVVGLDGTLRVDHLSPGDFVWFFDLEASEDLDQHGAKIQPRNFHGRAPGPRWPSAKRLRVFSRTAHP